MINEIFYTEHWQGSFLRNFSLNYSWLLATCAFIYSLDILDFFFAVPIKFCHFSSPRNLGFVGVSCNIGVHSVLSQNIYRNRDRRGFWPSFRFWDFFVPSVRKCETSFDFYTFRGCFSFYTSINRLSWGEICTLLYTEILLRSRCRN